MTLPDLSVQKYAALSKIPIHLVHLAHCQSQEGAFTHSKLVICRHRVHLTVRWLVHLTQLSLRCQTWNQYIMKSRVFECTDSMLNLNVAILCCAGPSYRCNYSCNNSSFVGQADAPSSSLCHVQSRCSWRPQIGCLSHTESFDKSLYVHTLCRTWNIILHNSFRKSGKM